MSRDKKAYIKRKDIHKMNVKKWRIQLDEQAVTQSMSSPLSSHLFRSVIWRTGGLIILLMEREEEASTEEPVFDIIHNARSSRASRSRKSSVHLL
jgi:hypothetical protein